MPDEFGLIQRLCQTIPSHGSHHNNATVDLGPGDDAALLSVPADQQLVVCTDTLNADIHFFADANPADIAYKALAVNLSDLAAMGATPQWVTLNLSLPATTVKPSDWVDQFAKGFSELVLQHQVGLIGGDLCTGPLTITVTAIGLVPKGSAVQRQGALPGDAIYVSGALGAASAALQLIKNKQAVANELLQHLLRPMPRVELGQALRPVVSSMIDISDGLLADLNHLLKASAVSATINTALLPVSQALLAEPNYDWLWPATGGDDYELCFTVHQQNRHFLDDISAKTSVPLTCIGEISHGAGLTCLDPQGQLIKPETMGWKHF